MYLEHDFVILSITQRQYPFCFDVQVLQQLLNPLTLGCTSWQYLQKILLNSSFSLIVGPIRFQTVHFVDSILC